MNSEILNHWRLQESLLQSYRSQFLSSQSIVIGIATFLVDAKPYMAGLFWLFWVLGLCMLLMGARITYFRGLDVSYCQMLLLKADKGELVENIMTNFKAWQSLPKSAKLAQLKIYSLTKSPTRKMMGLIIPLIYLVIWIVLAYLRVRCESVLYPICTTLE